MTSLWKHNTCFAIEEIDFSETNWFHHGSGVKLERTFAAKCPSLAFQWECVSTAWTTNMLIEPFLQENNHFPGEKSHKRLEHNSYTLTEKCSGRWTGYQWPKAITQAFPNPKLFWCIIQCVAQQLRYCLSIYCISSYFQHRKTDRDVPLNSWCSEAGRRTQRSATAPHDKS